MTNQGVNSLHDDWRLVPHSDRSAIEQPSLMSVQSFPFDSYAAPSWILSFTPPSSSSLPHGVIM